MYYKLRLKKRSSARFYYMSHTNSIDNHLKIECK